MTEDTIVAIADSGSPMQFLQENKAGKLQEMVKEHIPKEEDAANILACYNGLYIEC